MRVVLVHVGADAAAIHVVRLRRDVRKRAAWVRCHALRARRGFREEVRAAVSAGAAQSRRAGKCAAVAVASAWGSVGDGVEAHRHGLEAHLQRVVADHLGDVVDDLIIVLAFMRRIVAVGSKTGPAGAHRRQAAVQRAGVERNAVQSVGSRDVVAGVVLQVGVVAPVENETEFVDQRGREAVRLADVVVRAYVGLEGALVASDSIERVAQGHDKVVDDVLVIDAESGQVFGADVPVQLAIPIDRIRGLVQVHRVVAGCRS